MTETREIPIEYGTVLNVLHEKNPSPLLMNALDSLSNFPSIQRYQKKNSDVVDQNSNQIRSVHDPVAKFPKVGQNHKFSKSTDEAMLVDSLRLKQRPGIESGEKSMIGTTVASYLDSFQYPPPGTEKISPGFVAQRREIYSKEIARPSRINSRQRSLSSQSSEDSDEHEKQKLSRRRSAPNQRKPKVTITGISTTDLENGKSANLSGSDLPTSFYLLKKSQNSAQFKKNPGIKEHSPSYRTIIKFGKNREIVPDSENDLPMPQAVLKPGEVKLRSTTFVENTSPQHCSSSERSSITPDFVKSRTSPSEQLSPESIRRQCDEIYSIVQKHGCQLPQGFEEPSPLKRMHSNGSTKSSSPSTTSGGGLPPMQHPLHIAFEPFDKLKNTGKMENPEAEIDRLQRELYDAQVCNYRLNAQLGQLASKDWKKESSELKKSLKDKSLEIENLKKRLEKAERDRRTLESRQPSDVQALQGEKRELQIALEREETEKHELFMQINQLIAELADLRSNAGTDSVSKELREQLDQLKGQIKIVENERDELKESTSQLESSKKILEDELYEAKENFERTKAMSEIEKQKLKQEIELAQKEVQIKSAALQSLKLAKNEPSTSQEEVDKIVEEKNSLQRKLEEKEQEIEKINLKLKNLENSLDSEKQSTQNLVKDFEKKIGTLEEKISSQNTELTSLNGQLSTASSHSSSEIFLLNQKIQESETKIHELLKNLEISKKNTEEAENQAAELEEKLAQAEEGIEQLQEELQSKVKSTRDGDVKIEMVTNELKMAKEVIETRDKELEKEKKELIEIQEKFKKLKEEADGHKNEKLSVQEELQKRLADINQLNSNIADLQTKIKEIEKENAKLMEKASVEEELVTLVTSLQEARNRISLKETEVTDLRQKLNEQQDETDKLASELRNIQSSLERSEEENKKFINQEFELSEYRKESEKKFESVRKELNDEVLKAKVEIGNLVSQLETSKTVNEKLENEIKDLTNQNEVRLEKLQKVEMEKGRFETNLMEEQSKVTLLEKEIGLLKEQLKTSGTETTTEIVSLKSEINSLQDQLKEKSEENSKLATQVSELALLKETLESHKTTINNLRNTISSLESEKSNLISTKENLSSSESSKNSEILQLKKDLAEKENQLDQLTNSALELQVIRNTLNELHSKLEVSQSENTAKQDEIRLLKEELEKKDEMLKLERESSSLKSSEAEKLLQGKVEQLSTEKIHLESLLEKQKETFTNDLKKVQEESAESVKRLTELLTNEGKRLDGISREKEVLIEEKVNLNHQKTSLEKKLQKLEMEVKELKEREPEVREISDEELKRKVSELMEENARLAGDLLKKSDTEDTSTLRMEYEQALLQKQKEWFREKDRLQMQIEEQESDIRKLHQSKVDLEADLQRLKLSAESVPIPKPRRANTSLTNLTLDTLSERSITPSADEEEVKKLRNELDKQKRLITVLRKKLQQQQVDAHRQSKLSLNSATSGSPFL